MTRIAASAAVPSVHIVIVNWNAGQMLRACLQSVLTAEQKHWRLSRVTVVDNGSTDESLATCTGLNLPLRILRNTENRGFAAACNQCVVGHEQDYVLFLNPDMLLGTDSLDVACAYMQGEGRQQQVGICGIQLTDDDGAVHRSCARFPGALEICNEMLGTARFFPRFCKGILRRDWAHDENAMIDHVIGAFFLVRSELFAVLNGFDERYFVYFEDLDFSKRALEAGWRSHFIAAVSAYHKGGGTSDNVRALRTYYMCRSRLLYGYRHLPRLQALILTALTLCVEPLARYAHALKQRSPRHALETTSALAMLWRDALRGQLGPAAMLSHRQKQADAD